MSATCLEGLRDTQALWPGGKGEGGGGWREWAETVMGHLETYIGIVIDTPRDTRVVRTDAQSAFTLRMR